MGRKAAKLGSSLSELAKEALEQIEDAKLVKRLQSIVALERHDNKVVAEVMNVTTRSLSSWVRRFKCEGVDGLIDKPKKARKTKLSQEARQQVFEWIDRRTDARGKEVTWTLEKLKASIESVFSASMSIGGIWKMLQKEGFVLKVPRPRHRKSSVEATVAFKKTSRRARGAS